MGVVYRCPGVDEYGRGLTAQTVHMNGCCSAFLLMSEERKARVGLKIPATYVPEEPRPAPPDQRLLTVPELIKLVEKMIARAAEFPDEVPPGASVLVEYGPSHTLEDVLALYDLGRPYNLVLGYRRVPTDPEEGSK